MGGIRFMQMLRRHKRSLLWGLLVLVLLGVIALETAVIVVQNEVNQKVEAQSKKAFTEFLKQGQVVSEGVGTGVLLHHVRFCWSTNICINTNQLSAVMVSLQPSTPVVLDAMNRFVIHIHQGTVYITPKTLEGMLNESVFNFPGSHLRNLTVSIQQVAGHNHVRLEGDLKYLIWIPFNMDTVLTVDHKTNTLVISVDKLHVFGFIPAFGLIHLKPFHLEKLISLPENHSLTVHQNLMMIKPFGLFPPPRVIGTMSNIVVMPKVIALEFSGSPVSFSGLPKADAPRFVYLRGGPMQFGRLKMADTQIEILDKDPGRFFQLSLLNYQHYLPLSDVQLQPDGSAVLRMPHHHEGSPE